MRLVLVRSQSAFGFSMIYVVFDDNVELYFARTRVLEHMSLITKGLDYVGVLGETLKRRIEHSGSDGALPRNAKLRSGGTTFQRITRCFLFQATMN